MWVSILSTASPLTEGWDEAATGVALFLLADLMPREAKLLMFDFK
jgi:hypothetical protein